VKPLYDRWWGALLICGGALFLYFMVGQIVPIVFVVVEMLRHEGLPSDLEQGFAYYIPFITAFSPAASLLVFGLLRGLKQLAPSPREPAMTPLGSALVALAGGAAALAGGQALQRGLDHVGLHVNEQPAVVLAFHALDRFTLAGGIGFLAPVGEELIFRRIGFATLLRGTNRFFAYFLTMLVFAAIHGNLSAFVVYLWLGFVLAYTYEKTGRIEVSIAVHAINNLTAVVLST
jgi:membrane protease YdiL (CAAX protease family)